MAGARRYLTFALLAAMMVLTAMQFSTSAVALPALIDDLNPPLRWAGWVFATYTLGTIVSAPLAGRLTTRLGARAVYVTGVVGFALFSLACSLAPNIWVLILARAAQGMSGGLVQPSTFGLIGAYFPDQRARWVGLMSSLIPLAALFGPNIGGLLVDQLGWRWSFGFNTPLALLLALAAFVLLPRTAGRRDVRLNVTSVVMLAVFATTLIYALTELGRRGVSPNPLIVGGFLGISGAVLVTLLRREARSSDPIVDVDLLRRREFMFANALGFAFGFCFLGLFSFIPLYAQEAYELTASETGAMLTPRALAMVAASTCAALLLMRTGYRKPVVLSWCIQSALLFVLALRLEDPVIAGMELSSFVWLALVNGAFGLAFGIGNPAMSNAALDLAPDRIPAVAGLRGMFTSLGGTVGVAVITAVTARAESITQGLQLSFACVAVLFAGAGFLVFGIPEMRREPRTLPPLAAAEAD